LSAIPAYTTLSDVIAHLGVEGSDPNYTVYGLPISSSVIQAHVDHANKYIYSLVPNLDPSDTRYVSAQLAATDLACMAVLVVSVGGALVGAYDYTLGDERVSRAGPYASAIKTAIAGYRASAMQNLANVTTVAVGTVAAASYRVPRRY
jgi:hypothetical protein